MKKVMRKIIEIDEERCDGCGQCVPACAEGAIQVIDGKAKLVADKYCDGLGACLGDCPMDALHVIEREAEDFDEEAVEEYLKTVAQPEDGGRANDGLRMPFHADPELRRRQGLSECGPGRWRRPGRIGPDPLADPDQVDPAHGSFPERSGSADPCRLCRGGLCGAPQGPDGGTGGDDGMPEARRCRGLHREVHGGLQDGKTAQHHDRHDGGALLFRPLTHRERGPEGIPAAIPMEEVVFSVRGEPLEKMKASA